MTYSLIDFIVLGINIGYLVFMFSLISRTVTFSKIRIVLNQILEILYGCTYTLLILILMIHDNSFSVTDLNMDLTIFEENIEEVKVEEQIEKIGVKEQIEKIKVEINIEKVKVEVNIEKTKVEINIMVPAEVPTSSDLTPNGELKEKTLLQHPEHSQDNPTICGKACCALCELGSYVYKHKWKIIGTYVVYFIARTLGVE